MQQRSNSERAISVVLFNLDNHEYAIRTDSIQSIVTFDSVTFVPGAPPRVEGVINVRGDVFAAVRLQKDNNISTDETLTASSTSKQVGLVVEFEQHPPVALLVNQVSQVVSMSTDDFEDRNEIIDTGKSETNRLLRLNGKVVSLIETDELSFDREGVVG